MDFNLKVLPGSTTHFLFSSRFRITEKFFSALSAVDGVAACSSRSAYEVVLSKGELFTTEEVEKAILAFLDVTPAPVSDDEVIAEAPEFTLVYAQNALSGLLNNHINYGDMRYEIRDFITDNAKALAPIVARFAGKAVPPKDEKRAAEAQKIAHKKLLNLLHEFFFSAEVYRIDRFINHEKTELLEILRDL